MELYETLMEPLEGSDFIGEKSLFRACFRAIDLLDCTKIVSDGQYSTFLLAGMSLDCSLCVLCLFGKLICRFSND